MPYITELPGVFRNCPTIDLRGVGVDMLACLWSKLVLGYTVSWAWREGFVHGLTQTLNTNHVALQSGFSEASLKETESKGTLHGVHDLKPLKHWDD